MGISFTNFSDWPTTLPDSQSTSEIVAANGAQITWRPPRESMVSSGVPRCTVSSKPASTVTTLPGMGDSRVDAPLDTSEETKHTMSQGPWTREGGPVTSCKARLSARVPLWKPETASNTKVRSSTLMLNASPNCKLQVASSELQLPNYLIASCKLQLPNCNCRIA